MPVQDLDATPEQPSSPRARRTRKRASRLLRMPLDIIYEILSRLAPKDLLSMSRVTKAFRGMLLGRASAQAPWRNALARVPGLPPPPEGMSEPRLVYLIYGTNCQASAMRRSHAPLSQMRENAVSTIVDIAHHLARFVECEDLPTYHILKRFFPTGSLDMVNYIPYIQRIDRGRRQELFCVRSAARLAREVMDMATGSSKRQMTREGMHERQQQNYLVRVAYYAAASREADIQFDALQLALRFANVAVQHSRENTQSGIDGGGPERRSEVIRRLKALGFEKELVTYPDALRQASYLRNKAAKSTKPLSDKHWDRMHGVAVAELKKLYRFRTVSDTTKALSARHEVLVDTYTDLRRSLPFRAFVPTVGDIANAPSVRALLTQPPQQPKPTPAVMQAALAAEPPAFFEDWRTAREDTLLMIIHSRTVSDPCAAAEFAPGNLTRATLRLASTVFMNPKTGALFSYPHVLCAPALDIHPSQCPGERGWDPKQLTVRGECAGVVRRMAVLAGLDPWTTTALEMDELDAWYYYPEADKPGQRRALPWRYVTKLGMPDRRFEILGPEQMAEARAIADARACDVKFVDGDSLCAHCQARFFESTALYTHLREAHNIATPTRKDFILGFGVEYPPGKPVLLSMPIDGAETHASILG
ncbi:hypothetical protein K523DRAFT_330798 [Schizophyllum commune Tattone D]|nr:hypothetical protein K523DRAFT_330798 [Schizophyllum commune Tattone D]